MPKTPPKIQICVSHGRNRKLFNCSLAFSSIKTIEKKIRKNTQMFEEIQKKNDRSTISGCILGRFYFYFYVELLCKKVEKGYRNRTCHFLHTFRITGLVLLASYSFAFFPILFICLASRFSLLPFFFLPI